MSFVYILQITKKYKIPEDSNVLYINISTTAEQLLSLKVAKLLLLRISLKPSSYGKVDEAIVTSF